MIGLIRRHPLWMSISLGAVQAVAGAFIFHGALSAILQMAGFALFAHHIKGVAKGFANAWVFACTWLLGSVAWLYIALHVHGHMNAVISVAAILLLCGGLAIYYGTSTWVYWKLQGRLKPWMGASLLAASWTLAEMARAQWFTGFPWAAMGYSHVNSYLSYGAPVVGVYGIGFLAVFMAAVLAHAWQSQDKKSKAMVILILLLLLIPVPRSNEAKGEKTSFRLLQANIEQDSKYAGSRLEAMNWYKEQMLASPAHVTVLPETAIPFFKDDMPQSYWEEIEQRFQSQKQAVIIGIPTRNPGAGYGNSAIQLGMTEGPKIYHKFHLVPFGEFTPQSFKWFNDWVDLGLTDFVRGSQHPNPFVWGKSKLSLNICYEDLFGEELAKRFVVSEEQTPDILVNISNLGWFGDNYVVDQHLNIARMRSLEFNRPTVRATNSGGTAIINAQGVIEHRLTPYTRGTLTGEVQSHAQGITPFAYWAGHWGLWPLWFGCMALWGWAFLQYKKNFGDGNAKRAH